MPDYQKGKIYTIRCRTDDELIYVGSTIMTLSKRLAEHRYASVNKQKTGKRFYKDVENWDDWYIELYEEYPCENKQQLNRKEGEIIRKIGTLNIRIEGRTQKEWKQAYYENHREESLEVNKKWMEKNKEYRKEYKKAYREANKEKIAEYRAEYFRNVERQNKDERNKKQRENYAKRQALNNTD
jgi:hypothetical protein